MAKRTQPCGDPDCPTHKAFDMLGKPHVLDLLFVLVHESPGPWRFTALKNRLEIASNILSDRLTALASVGLVTRTQYTEMPPRVEYEATADAMDMDDAFTAFSRWAAKRHKKQVHGNNASGADRPSGLQAMAGDNRK
jgi:DNA-binding HxlR family transcriptional regulator